MYHLDLFDEENKNMKGKFNIWPVALATGVSMFQPQNKVDSK